MKYYKQLTAEDRIEIYAMLPAGKSLKIIAMAPSVHPSTGLHGYRPKIIMTGQAAIFALKYPWLYPLCD